MLGSKGQDEVKIRDVRPGRRVLPAATCAAILRDDLFLGDHTGRITQIEVNKGRVVEVFKDDAVSPINCIYAALGFVWTGHVDSLIRQWTVTSGEKYREMKGHRGAILSLAIMGKSMFSGSEDGFIYEWDLVTGDGINFMPMTRPVLTLAVWHSAKILLAGDMNGRMVYWDTVSGPTPQIVKEVYCAAQQDGVGRTMIPPTHCIAVEKLKRDKGGVSEELHAGWIFAAVGNDRVEQRYLAEGKLKRNLMHPARVNDMSVAQSCLFTACDDKVGRAWDVNSGGLLQQFMGHLGCLAVVLSYPQEEIHNNADMPRDIHAMRPGTFSGTRSLFTCAKDGGVIQWKVASRNACRRFATYLDETSKSGVAAKEEFRMRMAEAGLEPVDPFEAQQEAELEIQKKMESLGGSGKDFVEPPDPPRTLKRSPKKRSPSKKGLSPKKEKKVSVKALEAQAREMEDKKAKLSKLGYTSQMALMGFVNDVTQNFVAKPPQRHFPGRGVSVDDHAAMYRLIKSDWEEVMKGLDRENAQKRTKMLMEATAAKAREAALSATDSGGSQHSSKRGTPAGSPSLPPINKRR